MKEIEDDEDIVRIIEVDDDKRRKKKKKDRNDTLILKEDSSQRQEEPHDEEEKEEPFDPSRPFPDLADMSFNCLHQTSHLRQLCIRMVQNPYPPAGQDTEKKNSISHCMPLLRKRRDFCSHFLLLL
jgi:hypothetical protein